MRRLVLVTSLVAALIGGAMFATACDDDDTIGENIDQALETVDEFSEDVGDKVGTQVADIGDDEETPTVTASPTVGNAQTPSLP